MKSEHRPTVLPVTMREAALRLSIPYKTLQAAVKRGDISAERLSPRYVLVYLEDVQAWLDKPEMHKPGLGSKRYTKPNPRKKQ